MVRLPEYRQAREIRRNAAHVRMLFVEGSQPEGFTLPTRPVP
ncbi:hypothetical protein [Streptomyces sp. SID3343]